ncbi:hypothetical protein Rhe02_58110 [Rhizocola hellebori]|uniref:Lipoprotein n=1 Tax=Rhizocola hellebori TaxID=1392758 RepID=A0A8J3QDH0_9ACTN|nr:hypothetical protein [Rhizocola hellebori]GIH07744.1 hypothetical protein Rhe02_58110 [Rhizocola hellebori]
MRRITLHLSLLALACAVSLAACGNDGDAGSTANSPVTGPGKNTSDEPELPTLPAPRGPALRVDAKYTYKVQVLDAMTTLSLPDKPPLAGTTALAVLLRIEADPANRPIVAPAQDLQINFPSCISDQNQYLACQLDGGTNFLTEDQMRFGAEAAKGISGTLAANTVYYRWAWQLISEKADLTGASLCQVGSKDNCVPIGAIRQDS